MTQTPRNAGFQKAVGQRLDELVRIHLKITWKKLGDMLGYDNSSSLLRSRDGKSSLSAAKLATLASLDIVEGGGHVSIDWLLTGVGDPIQGQALGKCAIAPLGARVERAAPDVKAKIAAYLDVHEMRPADTLPQD